MSSSTASGRGSAAISMNAASRVSASTASRPSSSSQPRMSSRNSGSSSTTRMRCFILSPGTGVTGMQRHDRLGRSKNELNQRAGGSASVTWERGNQGPDQEPQCPLERSDLTYFMPASKPGQDLSWLSLQKKMPGSDDAIRQ